MKKIQTIEETILLYTSAWNETDRAVIAQKIAGCWAPAGTFTDRVTDTITGREAIIDLIIGSFDKMGPRTFIVLREPAAHHQCGTFHWLAIRPEGYPVPGQDFVEFDQDNLITRIVGFF